MPTAIQREKRDSRAGLQPLSLWIIAVYCVAIFWAGFYVGRYSGSFHGDSLDPSGEGRPIAPSASVSPANASVTADSAAALPGAPQVVQVAIRNMKFDPATVEVKVGDTVEWKNDDITPHTATSTTFDSGPIESDKSWRRAFTEAGQFPYACTFHPEMKGTVIIKNP